MGKKHFKKAIASLKARIAEHELKIEKECAKDFPDQRLINHWSKEILAFEDGIRRKKKRLGKK